MQAALPIPEEVTMMTAESSVLVLYDRGPCDWQLLHHRLALLLGHGSLPSLLPSPVSLLSQALYLGVKAMVGTGLFPLVIWLGPTPAIWVNCFKSLWLYFF